MTLNQLIVEFQCFFGGRPRIWKTLLRLHHAIVSREIEDRREVGISESVLRISLDCVSEILNALPKPVPRPRLEPVAPLEIMLIGFRTFGVAPVHPGLFVSEI